MDEDKRVRHNWDHVNTQLDFWNRSPEEELNSVLLKLSLVRGSRQGWEDFGLVRPRI